MFDDDAFRSTLPPDELDALCTYKRAEATNGDKDYAAWLNRLLLAGKPIPDDTRAVLEGLDRATRRFRLPRPATLYRATFDVVMERFSGPEFAYPAFMSVARHDRALARHFAPKEPDCAGVLLRIHCQAGAPMALVEWTHPPDGADEAECLLPRGTRFRVTGRRTGTRDELLRYAGPECAGKLRGLDIWELEMQ